MHREGRLWVFKNDRIDLKGNMVASFRALSFITHMHCRYISPINIQIYTTRAAHCHKNHLPIHVTAI